VRVDHRFALQGRNYKAQGNALGKEGGVAQSLSNILIHLIFSTKGRRPFISSNIRLELNSYLAGILRQQDCHPLIVNGVEDHIHILFALSRNHALADILSEVKRSSSKWIKTKGDEFHDFSWQDGYGAFSVSQSNWEAVRDYIADQADHHRRVSFQEELRNFLVKNNIPFDERYLWD
jgi:putative transposase